MSKIIRKLNEIMPSLERMIAILAVLISVLWYFASIDRRLHALEQANIYTQEQIKVEREANIRFEGKIDKIWDHISRVNQ